MHQKKDLAINPDFSPQQLQRYIRYAKSIKPTITEEAAIAFQQYYLKLRQSDSLGHGRMAYRITVRQLESMIRLSEALARLYCQDKVTKRHVDEAARLLKKSIIHVETQDVTLDDVVKYLSPIHHQL